MPNICFTFSEWSIFQDKQIEKTNKCRKDDKIGNWILNLGKSLVNAKAIRWKVDGGLYNGEM